MPISNATTKAPMTLRQALLVATALTKAKGQKRWPAGSPKGGQFAPSGVGGGGAPVQGSMFDLSAWAPATKPVTGNPAGMHGLKGGSAFDGAGWKPKGADKPQKPAVVPPGWEDAPGYLVPKKPTKPSPVEDNTNPEDAAVYVRGHASGDGVNGLAFSPWSPPQDWNGVEGQRPDIDAGLPPLDVPEGKHAGAGVVVLEPDGRVWLVHPTNKFGGYSATFPKGTVEPEIRSLQANAIKETWEEAGLKVKITGVVGDYERSTSVARYYIAERVGGDPADHGWESQAVSLVPLEDALDVLNTTVDRKILSDFAGKIGKRADGDLEGHSWLRGGVPSEFAGPGEKLRSPHSGHDGQSATVGGANSGRYAGEPRLSDGPPHVRQPAGQEDGASLGGRGVSSRAIDAGYASEPQGRVALEQFGAEPRMGHTSRQPSARSGYGPVGAPAGERGREWQRSLDGSRSDAGAVDVSEQEHEGYRRRDGHPVHHSSSHGAENYLGARGVAERVRSAASIAKALLRSGWPRDLLVEKAKKGKGGINQPRWPAGTTWGGRWKPSASAGGAAALVEAGKEFQPALATGKNPDNSALKAANKKITVYAEKANAGDVGFFTEIEASGKAPKTEGKLNPYQVALAVNFEEAKGYAQAKAGVKAKPKAKGGDEGGDDAPVKLSTMTKVAAKPGGSADGAIYQDASGQKWLVKGYKNSDQAKSEVLASKLYAAAGVASPDMKLVDLEGKHGNGNIGVMSKWEDGLSKFDKGNAAHMEGARGSFGAVAWLRDWDAVGMGFDNVAITPDGKAMQVDPGGALEFRAQGDLKPGGLPTKVDEWDTLRDGKTNAQAAAVYGGMTTTDLIAAGKKVTAVDDATIKAMVDKYGPGSKTKKAAMAAALMARRDDIALKVAALEAKVAKPKAAAKPKAVKAPAADAAPAAPKAADMNPDGMPKPLTYGDFPNAKTATFYENKVAAAHMALNAGDMAYFEAIAGYVPGTKSGQKSANFKAFKAHMDEVKAAAAGKAGSNATPSAKATDAPKAVSIPDKAKPLTSDEASNAWSAVDAKLGEDWHDGVAAKASKLFYAAKNGDAKAVADFSTGGHAGLDAYKAELLTAMGVNVPKQDAPKGVKAIQPGEGPLKDAPYLPSMSVLNIGHNATIDEIANAANKGDLAAVQAVDTLGDGTLNAFKADVISYMTAGTARSGTAPSPTPDAPSATIDTAGLDNALAAKPSAASLTTPSNPNKKLLAKIADVEAIAQSVKDGKTSPADAIAAIQAQKFGSNTYGKKGQAFADNVVAALGGYKAGAAGDAAKVTAASPKAPDVPAKGVKPKPHFKAENLGTPPDFTNWNGTGKGLSSKAQVNEANTAAAKAAYEVALKGDLAALKAMTFPEISKETGQPTGKMLPYSQHPSQHVAAYHANLVNEIDLMLNPPRMPVLGKVVAGENFDGGVDDIKAVAPGKAVAAVAKSQKAGAYIVLGKVTEPFKVPKADDSVVASAAWKQKTKAWYKTVPKAAKDTIGYYVGAGSGPLNQALQDGNLSVKPNTSSYGFNPKTVAQHIKDFKAALVDVPEGTTFVRNMGNKGYNKKADPITIKKLQDFLLNAEKGTVVQEPAFTSASWTGGNSVLSNNDIQWKFTAGKGVKVSPGWATFNQGEGEALFPPNQRYMIVGAKKVGKTVVVDAVLLPFDDYAA